MTKAKFYEVGGCVRDSLLGVKSKDIDFSVEADSYEAMRLAVAIRCGGQDAIKVEKPEFVTIRAIDPKLGGVDFVLCRKDGTYDKDGRRPDFIERGTLLDDLARRDFTVNAMARGEDGSIIDPFCGQGDLTYRILRCVGNTEKRMKEDALRMLRAIRFSITKGFRLDSELESFLYKQSNVDLLRNVSIERIREELTKCFEFDTLATLQTLEKFFRVRNHCFGRNLKLKPTIYAK